MALFFITTPMKNNEKQFQFNFETNEAKSVEEFMGILEEGRSIIGDRFFRNNPAEARSRMAITLSMIGMVQEYVPTQHHKAA